MRSPDVIKFLRREQKKVEDNRKLLNKVLVKTEPKEDPSPPPPPPPETDWTLKDASKS
jgi:hypothetical protein